MPKLLALDLSTSVGHAVMEYGRPPLFGTLELKLEGDDRSWRLGKFLSWLGDMHSVHRFGGIAWERPLLLRTDKPDVLEVLFGLVGIAYAFAGMHRLPWREITVQEVKLALTDKPNATKDEMKYAAMTYFDWKIRTDHEADAGAVGLVAYEQLFPAVPA